MLFKPLALSGAFAVELEKREDERGFFARAFCAHEFQVQGLETKSVQVNTSFSHRKGTIRGMHFQRPPRAETKLVRCTRGSALDVIVDIRAGSPTYGQWLSYELTADARNAIYVPHGFAHGFQALEANTEVMYFLSEFYTPELEGGLRYDDPQLNINWPVPPVNISPKDQSHPFLAQFEAVSL